MEVPNIDVTSRRILANAETVSKTQFGVFRIAVRTC